MLSKTISLFFLSPFAILATAAPQPGTTTTITAIASSATTLAQCNTGDARCCNSVGPANSLPGVSNLLGPLGAILQDVTVTVGLACTPLTVIGAGLGGANCAQQPVCCSDNRFDGLVNIGCSAISL